MATLSKQGNEIARWQVDAAHGSARYSLRDNGRLLKQVRIIGKWETWKIDATTKPGVDPREFIAAVERRMIRTYGTDATITRL